MADYVNLYRTKWPINIYNIGQSCYYNLGDKYDIKTAKKRI